MPHPDPSQVVSRFFATHDPVVRSKSIIYIDGGRRRGDSMTITLNVYYKGKDGSACRFVEDMVSEGILGDVRAEDGCLGYSYYSSMDDDEVVLLVEHWRDESALDVHSVSPNMARIVALKERHGLMTDIERFSG